MKGKNHSMICEIDLEGKKESLCEKQFKKMTSFIY